MAALCSNFTPGDVAGFYDDPATLRQMFSPRWVDRVPLLRCVLPRYSSVGKARALAAMLDRGQQGGEPPPSTILMREWPAFLTRDIRLLITAFDYDRERVAFFRSHTASRAQSSAPATEVTLAAALHASTNAPILFYDRPAEVGGRRYWDGAFAGYNNPVLAAVIEALANAPERADDLRVLSIGTGTLWQPCVADDVPPPFGLVREGLGQIAAIRKAATVIIADPPDAATFHAHVALRQPMPATAAASTAGNVVRLCALFRPLWDSTRGWQWPTGFDERDFDGYKEMALDAMDRRALDLVARVTAGWFADAIPNQPIRGGERMRCDIGHATFGAAVDHWKRIA